MEKTEALLGYCAGFFDGEGTVAMGKEKHHHAHALRVVIYNSNKEILDIFQGLWGGSLTCRVKGSLTGVKYTARRDVWGLQFAEDQQAYHLITDLLPYIRVKQRQFRLAKEYIEKIRNLRSLRRKGQRYTGIELAYRKEVHTRMKHLNAADESLGKEPSVTLPEIPKLF